MTVVEGEGVEGNDQLHDGVRRVINVLGDGLDLEHGAVRFESRQLATRKAIRIAPEAISAYSNQRNIPASNSLPAWLP
jgi:hypothetical protein